MHRHGYDLQLTQYDDRGWRATFYVSGVEHSPVAATGTAWEATAWRAVQRAAWRALVRVQDGKLRVSVDRDHSDRSIVITRIGRS